VSHWALPSRRQATSARLDYWHLLDITCYPCWAQFTAQNAGPFYYLSTKAGSVHSKIAYPQKVYIVFGREDAGLPEALLRANREHCLRLPMIEGARSLNLSTPWRHGLRGAAQWGYPGLYRREMADTPADATAVDDIKGCNRPQSWRRFFVGERFALTYRHVKMKATKGGIVCFATSNGSLYLVPIPWREAL
jgi:hypothetical protein